MVNHIIHAWGHRTLLEHDANASDIDGCTRWASCGGHVWYVKKRSRFRMNENRRHVIDALVMSHAQDMRIGVNTLVWSTDRPPRPKMAQKHVMESRRYMERLL